MKDQIELDGKMVHAADIMNPAGMFANGERIREHSQKDILPASGKLIPDFTGRQNIRDMFTKRPSLQAKPTSIASGLDSPEKDSFKAAGADTQPVEFAAKVSSNPVSEASPSSQRSTGPSGTTAPLKRSFTGKSTGTKTAKKIKNSSTANAASPGKGQSQISGFFKRKDEKIKPAPEASTPVGQSKATRQVCPDNNNDALLDLHNRQQFAKRGHTIGCEVDATVYNSESPGTGGAAEPRLMEDPARDLEESKEGWAKLFSKPQVPLCEHGEPCKQMLSKKQGLNYMRWFYMCARPLGPSGDKEKATQWRCGTFIWSSQASSNVS